MSFLSIISISLTAILAENVVFSQYLGITPLLGDSDSVGKAFKTGCGVALILTVSSIFAYLADGLLLSALGIGYMRNVVLVLVAAVIVQLLENYLKSKRPALYEKLGISFSMVSANSAILGVLLINSQSEYNFIEALASGIFSGIGFLAAITLFAAVRERLEYCDIPEAFKGVPITLITAGLIALAFMGFRGMLLV